MVLPMASRFLSFRGRGRDKVRDQFAVHSNSREWLVDTWWERQKRTPWLVPREERLSLLFFQKVYIRLVQTQSSDAKQQNSADLGVPLRDMQRVMARVFRLQGSDRTFDARRYDLRGDGFAGWWEFCLAWKEEKLTVRYSLAERIFITLEDPQASRMGRMCSIVVLLAILISAGSFIVSTLPEMQTQPCPRCEPEAHPAFEWIDTVCVVLFSVEYLLRLVTATIMRAQLINQEELVKATTSEELLIRPSHLQRAWLFARSWPSLIDLAAILPTYVAWISPRRPKETPGSGDGHTMVLLKLTRLMRVVRAFRLGRRFEAVVIIAKAMKRSVRILWVLVLNLSLNMVVFGAIIFLFEQGDYDVAQGQYLRPAKWVLSNTTGTYYRESEPSPFESIPHSFWWSLVTATTVGYGDMYPTTDLGKVTAGVAAVWSLCVLALPVGVIGANFQRVWEEYDREKRTEREMIIRAEKMERQAEGALDPLSLSRRLLFEVYHDSGMHTSANDVFLGEAEIELQLEPDSCEQVTRRLRLPLHENRDKSKRKVTGELQVKYSWIPSGPSKAGREHESGMELEGTLSVTVFSARNLVAVDWKGSGLSDPYVVLTVYPESPPEGGKVLEPKQVQTKTVVDDPAPIWNETCTFTFNWHRQGVLALRELERQLSIEAGLMLPLPSVQSSGQAPPSDEAARAAEAKRLMRSLPRLRCEVESLRAALPQIRMDLQQLRESCRELLRLLGEQPSAISVPPSPDAKCPGAFAMPGVVPDSAATTPHAEGAPG